jgi:proteasome accessory factor B
MANSKDEIYSRPPIERMGRIHELIKQGRYPNSVSLARELEVSERTVKRDLVFMQDRMSCPLTYDYQRHGYYYSKPFESFPHVTLSEAEVFALLIAHKAITQYNGTPFEKPLQIAFQKLTSQLDNQDRYTLDALDQVLSFRPFAPEDTDLAIFKALTEALKKQVTVSFQYKNLGTQKFQSRQVNPYHLACIDNRWYLFAFDEIRKAMRTFALTRMADLKLTTAHFQRPKDFTPDEYLRGSFGAFKGQDDYEVVLEFDAWAADLLRGRKWHASQEFIEIAGGGARLRMRLNNIEEVARWVLSWDTHVTVVRPEVLADRVYQVARELVEKYSPAAKKPDKNKPLL